MNKMEKQIHRTNDPIAFDLLCSTKGNIEVYSSTYGGILIYGNDGKTEAIFTAGTTTSFPKEQGKYQIAYYDNKYKYTFDSVDLKPCQTYRISH